MALVINTNTASLSAQRNLHTSQQALNTSLQRLSTGLRINSAKDDAAGLFSVERMTADIRGLNQAVRNSSDGISLAQTAEGSLSQIGDNLQRIREIAVQSANGTVEDRSGLQTEVDQLTQEISRIITTTEFNGTQLLSGSNALTFQVGADGVNNAQIAITTIDLTANGADPVAAAAQAIVDSLTGDAYSAIDNAVLTKLNYNSDPVGNGGSGLYNQDGSELVYVALDSVDAAAIAVFYAAQAVYDSGGGLNGGVATADMVTAAQAVADTYAGGGGAAVLSSYNSNLGAGSTIDVSSQSGAAAALATIDSDINQISSTRSSFGAMQNRFEAVVTNLQNYSENLSAARSRIQDTDFAMETAQLTRAQILQQAGVSMLAQANTKPQIALELLRA